MESVGLKNIPETMLWTLHNRVTEALRKDSIIKDNKAIEIYNSLKYQYENSFGKGEPSHAIRSLAFDDEIKGFLNSYPESYIINLGEGLETQRYRLKDKTAKWVTVDVPEAIEIREQFIEPDSDHIHLSLSALDRKWFESVPTDKPLFITAQGLLMYFKNGEVKSLLTAIIDEFYSGCIMFDTIPVWLSKKTLSKKGWKKTKNYTTPKMPWGINRNQINDIMSWSPKIKDITELPYKFPRGGQKLLYNTILNSPILNRHLPTMVKITF